MNLPPSRTAVLPGGFVLRRAVSADLPATARAHARLLPVGLFPSLGPRFLRRWHRTFLAEPYGVALVVVDPAAPGRGVVGFLLGSTHQAAHMVGILGSRRIVVGLAVAGLLALLRRPRLAAQFARTRGRAWLRRLVRRPGAGAEGATPAPTPVAVLAAIAVEPSARGHSLGTHLVTHFLDLARAGPADVAELVTAAGRDGASAFYERLGWQPRGQRATRDGTAVCTYVYQLAQPPSGSPSPDGHIPPSHVPPSRVPPSRVPPSRVPPRGE